MAFASLPATGLSCSSTVTAEPENAPPTIRSSVCSSGCGSVEDWQMSPMHQITAYRVPPMHIVPAETIRVELEEQVVAPLELAQAVRIVHPTCERFEMRARTPETVVDLFQRGLCRPIGVAWIHVHVANAVVKQVIAFGKVAEAYNQPFAATVTVDFCGTAMEK